jgi:hypothetical protein
MEVHPALLQKDYSEVERLHALLAHPFDEQPGGQNHRDSGEFSGGAGLSAIFAAKTIGYVDAGWYDVICITFYEGECWRLVRFPETFAS